MKLEIPRIENAAIRVISDCYLSVSGEAVKLRGKGVNQSPSPKDKFPVRAGGLAPL